MYIKKLRVKQAATMLRTNLRGLRQLHTEGKIVITREPDTDVEKVDLALPVNQEYFKSVRAI